MKTEKLLRKYEEAVEQRAVYAQKNRELNSLNQKLRSELTMKTNLLTMQKESLIELRKKEIDFKIKFYNELMERGVMKENTIGAELDKKRLEIWNTSK